jgi:RES domain-containing protein
VNIRAWRITKAKHAATAFSGGGAKAYGGRWSSPGIAVVYTAGSASLAMLEILVHLQSQELMKRYVSFEVTFDESIMTSVDSAGLPRSWHKSPVPFAVQAVGDAWAAERRSAVLRVPSVIVPSECNYLLNPAHSDFSRIKIGPKQPLRFDPRLIKKSAPA